MLRWSMEDGFGRPVGAHLTTLMFPTPGGSARAGKERLLALVRALTRLPLPEIDQRVDMFHSTTARALQAFWDRRAAREKSIERALVAERQAPAQRGLFDRRADDAARAAARARQADRAEVIARAVAAERARKAVAGPPHAALLLIV